MQFPRLRNRDGRLGSSLADCSPAEQRNLVNGLCRCGERAALAPDELTPIRVAIAAGLLRRAGAT
jgi:hypothetical protein